MKHLKNKEKKIKINALYKHAVSNGCRFSKLIKLTGCAITFELQCAVFRLVFGGNEAVNNKIMIFLRLKLAIIQNNSKTYVSVQTKTVVHSQGLPRWKIRFRNSSKSTRFDCIDRRRPIVCRLIITYWHYKRPPPSAFSRDELFIS